MGNLEREMWCLPDSVKASPRVSLINHAAICYKKIGTDHNLPYKKRNPAAKEITYPVAYNILSFGRILVLRVIISA